MVVLELARQILSNVRVLVTTRPYRRLYGLVVTSTLTKRLADRPVDVLIAIPGRLVKHRDAGDVFLGSERHVVIDEMDTMLEQGFQGGIGKLLHRCYIGRKWWRWRNTKMAK